MFQHRVGRLIRSVTPSGWRFCASGRKIKIILEPPDSPESAEGRRDDSRQKATPGLLRGSCSHLVNNQHHGSHDGADAEEWENPHFASPLFVSKCRVMPSDSPYASGLTGLVGASPDFPGTYYYQL